MNYPIRKAGYKDLSFLVKTSFPDGEPEKGFIQSIIENKRNVSLVCNDGKKIIGFIIGRVLTKYPSSSPDNGIWMQAIYNELLDGIVPDNHKFCEIYNLWIATEYRQKGFALKLKQTIESYLTSKEIYYIVSSTKKKNKPVIGLNKRLKYSIIKQNLTPEYVCFYKKLQCQSFSETA